MPCKSRPQFWWYGFTFGKNIFVLSNCNIIFHLYRPVNPYLNFDDMGLRSVKIQNGLSEIVFSILKCYFWIVFFALWRHATIFVAWIYPWYKSSKKILFSSNCNIIFRFCMMDKSMNLCVMGRWIAFFAVWRHALILVARIYPHWFQLPCKSMFQFWWNGFTLGKNSNCFVRDCIVNLEMLLLNFIFYSVTSCHNFGGIDLPLIQKLKENIIFLKL